MIYQSEWYKYPRSMRRFIELMIMRAQKPFYLSAYGLMICTLENFIKVGCYAITGSFLTMIRSKFISGAQQDLFRIHGSASRQLSVHI